MDLKQCAWNAWTYETQFKEQQLTIIKLLSQSDALNLIKSQSSAIIYVLSIALIE